MNRNKFKRLLRESKYFQYFIGKLKEFNSVLEEFCVEQEAEDFEIVVSTNDNRAIYKVKCVLVDSYKENDSFKKLLNMSDKFSIVGIAESEDDCYAVLEFEVSI